MVDQISNILHQPKVEAEGSTINSIKLFPKDLSWEKFFKVALRDPSSTSLMSWFT